MCPMLQIESVCIPCVRPCDAAVCDPDCSSSAIQEVLLSLDGLTLEPFTTHETDMGNMTLMQPYYLVVFGRAGKQEYILHCIILYLQWFSCNGSFYP